ncbi:MAG TPA: DUF2550 domain-containing protein [Marmoricola sp.]
MAVWRWLIDSAGVVLLAVLLYGLLLIIRRRWLARSGGTFELSVRTRPTDSGRGWILGVGRYEADALEWFRVFSLWPRPKRRYRRDQVSFRGQRAPTESESYALYAGHVVVVCSTATGDLELAMSPDSLTGFQSWLEAAPPSDPALGR